MKRKYLLTALFLIFHYLPVNAQSLAINTDGSTANASSILDIKSTTKGMLIPRMTMVNRNLIATPATGLMIYQTDNAPGFYYYDGSAWVSITSSGNSLWLQSGNNIYNSNTGNVGIGTNNPLAKLHIFESSFLATAAYPLPVTPSAPPLTGVGNRMMWYADKSAFRVGTCDPFSPTWWDKDSIGNYSFAAGYRVKAKGNVAISIGYDNESLADHSVTIGGSNKAVGTASLAIGEQNRAYGDYSVAVGRINYAYGISSFAAGLNSAANADYSTAIGPYATASGAWSTAIGTSNTAIGNYAMAMGFTSRAKSYADFATGLYNDSTTAGSSTAINAANRIFEIGNGTADNARSNAMTILQSGNVGIGTTTPVALLEVKRGAVLFDSTIGSTPVSGVGTRMMWIPAKAAIRAGSVTNTQWDDANIGQNSVGMGSNAIASGINSVALGYNNQSSGAHAVSMGNGNYAGGTASLAMGSINDVFGGNSFVMGRFNTVHANNAVALGDDNNVDGESSLAVGLTNYTSGIQSIAMGSENDATGSYSAAIGYFNNASGYASIALGRHSVTSGVYSAGIGYYNTASGYASAAIGYYNYSKSYAGCVVGVYNESASAADPLAINDLNRIFQVGNGYSDTYRRNAMTILHNGNTGIGLLAPGRLLSVAKDIGLDEDDDNNGTITNSLHFGGSSSGEAIASKRTATGNQYGLDFYTGSTAKLSISNTGNVGIGTTSPGAKLDVVGVTSTDGLQVGNGTTIIKMQSGSVVVGPSGTSELVYTLTFPVAFASSLPKVFATARNEVLTSYSDAFSVSIRSINSTSVTFNIQRTDTNGAWAQQLRVDWFAVE